MEERGVGRVYPGSQMMGWKPACGVGLSVRWRNRPFALAYPEPCELGLENREKDFQFLLGNIRGRELSGQGSNLRFPTFSDLF